MNKFFKRLIAVAGMLCFLAMAISALGIVPDGGIFSSVVTFFAGGGMVMATAGATPSNETIVAGEPLKESQKKAGSTDPEFPEYMARDINKKLTLIGPDEAIIDTLTRNIGYTTKCQNIKVEAEELGTRDHEDATTAATTKDTIVSLPVGKVAMWLPGDLALVDDGAVTDGSLTDEDGNPLQLYVVAMGETTGTVKVRATNMTDVPVIPTGTKLQRLSSAVHETTARVKTFGLKPAPYYNYCQVHMAMIEEALYHELMKKEIDFSFSTMKMKALLDFRMNMEYQNLFGVRGKTFNTDGDEVFTSAGLWSQFKNKALLTQGKIDNAEFIRICRLFFSGNNGSARRVMIGGDGFAEQIAAAEMFTKQLESKNTELVLGVTFNKIVSPFGEVLFKRSAMFTGIHSNDAVCFDPNFIEKKELEPLQTKLYNLDDLGEKRAHALRINNAYCLLAHNLPAQWKISIKAA